MRQLILAMLFCAGCSSTLENRVSELDNQTIHLENRVIELESQLIWIKYRASSTKGWADFSSERKHERLRDLEEKVWALKMKEMGFLTLPELAEKVLERLEDPELAKEILERFEAQRQRFEAQ